MPNWLIHLNWVLPVLSALVVGTFLVDLDHLFVENSCTLRNTVGDTDCIGDRSVLLFHSLKISLFFVSLGLFHALHVGLDHVWR